MNRYTANPNIVISPPVVLTLGAIAFFVSMVDIIIEFWSLILITKFVLSVREKLKRYATTD
jgi:hypothetical protein